MAGTAPSYNFNNVQANHTIRVVFAQDAPVQYTITASSGPNGSISPTGVVTVNQGASQIFTFTPSAGYHIDSVIVDGTMTGTAASYNFSNVQANRTIRVVFAQDAPVLFKITATAGPNGNISPQDTVTVTQGASQGFAFTPNSGYHVDSLYVDGTYTGSPSGYTFSNVQADHSIHVVFAQDLPNQFVITATAGPNGSVSPNGSITVSAGSDQGFVFTPGSGYHVDSVFADSIYIGSPLSYDFTNIQADHSIHVLFAQDPPVEYIIVASAGPNGTITPADTVVVPAGSGQLFTFTPAVSFLTDSVIVDGVLQSTSASYQFTDIQANHTIHVTFRPDPTRLGQNPGNEGLFSLSPNPSPAGICFKTTYEDLFTIEVYDATGKLVLLQENNPKTGVIPVEATGIYTVRMICVRETSILRAVVK
jgi:hypothetical protein